ncbi:hypothetical protein Tco_0086229 [Tanacetum coccineum]
MHSEAKRHLCVTEYPLARDDVVFLHLPLHFDSGVVPFVCVLKRLKRIFDKSHTLPHFHVFLTIDGMDSQCGHPSRTFRRLLRHVARAPVISLASEADFQVLSGKAHSLFASFSVSGSEDHCTFHRDGSAASYHYLGNLADRPNVSPLSPMSDVVAGIQWLLTSVGA